MARVAVYHGVNATIFRAKRHFLRSRGNVRFVFEKVIMQDVRYCGDWMTKDLSLPTFEIAMEYDARPKPIVMRVTSGEVNIVAFQHGF